tara:strand:- start:565 stop:1677 length:1113 start_codon:yes stop_codon:yes gene_type:complete
MNKYFENFYDWWKNIDKYILTLILGLFILGLFFSLVSTSLIASDKLNTNSYYFFLKHLSFILLGIIFLLFFSILKQKTLIKFSIIFFFISFFCLFLVPFLGIEVKGSKRWLDPFFLPRFQPIEILKPFFIIIISILLSLNNKKLYLKYIFSAGILIPILLLLISQPDLGQSLLITLSWLALIFVSGINILLFFSFFITAGITVSYLVFFVPKFEYIKLRLITFIDSSSGNNYQSEKASDAIINGGFFGKGIGEGTLNSRVPEAHTDYIVSVISEEFGAIIVIAIMLTYLILSYKIIQKINLTKDNNIKLILIGCTSIILLQSFIHIGVNIRLLPTTGMTLPFLSYGGSSIISTAFLCGIILNLTKRKIIQ